MGRSEGEGSCDNHLLISDLSEDVLIQILLWLPVISLLRFKSVCKSWRSIIQSPSFIHLHFATISSSSYSMVGDSGSSLLCPGYPNQEKKKVNYFTLSGEEFEVFEDLGIPPALDLGELKNEIYFLVRSKNEIEFQVVGCCNGLICLHEIDMRNVALWNPAIKQFRILPKPSNLLGNSNCLSSDYCGITDDFVRFGIDIKTNDHKVLRISTVMNVLENSSPHERRVYVYNLSTDSWRCITDDATLSTAHPYPDNPEYPNLQIQEHVSENPGLYLNGSYFFTAMYFAEENPWLMILSFDFTGEIFTTIQPPYGLRNQNDGGGSVYIIPFGEKLALVDPKVDQFHFTYYDIWVLNEPQQHGVKESSGLNYIPLGLSIARGQLRNRYALRIMESLLLYMVGIGQIMFRS